MRNLVSSLSLLLAVSALAACAPKVYVIDRQTVLEQESAGEWPEFEKDLYAKTPQSTATPLTSTKVSAAHARLYNVLDGELVEKNRSSTDKAIKK
jgi:hypothetical protein